MKGGKHCIIGGKPYLTKKNGGQSVGGNSMGGNHRQSYLVYGQVPIRTSFHHLGSHQDKFPSAKFGGRTSSHQKNMWNTPLLPNLLMGTCPDGNLDDGNLSGIHLI